MNDLEKGRRLLVGTGRVEPRVENGRKSRDAGERPQRGEKGLVMIITTNVMATVISESSNLQDFASLMPSSKTLQSWTRDTLQFVMQAGSVKGT